ncbi:MAG: hypothetical protein IKN43_13085 [Selenomonadaceae bacterium]|nr:hypothetical protein [Selenomonadaceae bacterium]
MTEHDMINEKSFQSLLKAVEEKKRILLVASPGAHGLTTLAMALIMHGDDNGLNYELFDSDLMRSRPGEGELYFAQLKSTADIQYLLKLWAHGGSGIAAMYANSVEDATEWLEAVMKKSGIKEAGAFVNCTIDIICMIENENGTSVVKDVVVLHH